MNELQELYQQVILDHNKNPRNFGIIDHADHSAKGHNPLCGDQIDVYISMDGDKISEIKFEGAGCAISKASASIMTTILKGKTKEEARKIFEEFHELVTNDNKNPDEIDIGKLAVFCGVREFPARVKCASLAWHTMINALAEKGKDFISTE
ncbi:MAG: Fe-S cluster assembly sulfur transfer protein SufU [Candidatus Kapaibacterium sp.]